MGLDMYLSVQLEARAYKQITPEIDVISDAAKDTLEALGIEWGECDPKTGETNPKALAVHTDCSWFTVTMPFAYWRKENAIHNYIVKNFAHGKDECQEIELDTEGVKEFVEVLKKVIATEGKVKDLTCRELLPTTSGFFFGSTDYDEWYWIGLKYTLERFESLLNYTKEVSDLEKWDSPKKIQKVIYRASW